MLRFALDHMRARVLGRLQERLGRLAAPSRRDLVETALEVMLPLDEAGRQEACVNVAFVGLATVDAGYADLLRLGYQRLVDASKAQLRAAAAAGELAAGVDPDGEAVALYFLAQGLVAPLLVAMLTPDEARALLRAAGPDLPVPETWEDGLNERMPSASSREAPGIGAGRSGGGGI